MFASLKNKIKEETGSDISTASSAATTTATSNRISNSSRIRSRFSSTVSVNSTEDTTGANNNVDLHNYQSEILSIRSQCNDLTTKLSDLNKRFQELQAEKSSVEKTNEILLDTVKETQRQKNSFYEEQEKIQNMQQAEIEKLKSLLSFREQEAVDRLTALRQSQQQIENLTGELEGLKKLEPMVEDLQDELERLRHSSQLSKNNLTTTLAAVEEDNRHLKTRLQIVNQSRLNTIESLGADEKIQALVQERKLLEQHLEEAHLQLSDIKSSWSVQNLALETQVSRLSKQVAEETTEKRKALKARDDCNEKLKKLEFELEKFSDDIKQRDEKIKILEEEIDELNLALKETRDESEHQKAFEHNKVETFELENQKLKDRLVASDDRLTEFAENSEKITQSLRKKNSELHQQLLDITNNLEQEKEEKLTALLRNAEISQSEEILKKELRIERDETNDLIEKTQQLQAELKAKHLELSNCKFEMDELKVVMLANNDKLMHLEEIQRELNDKNKTIKVLNQRLVDIKKTLQKEFRSNKSFDGVTNIEKTVEFQGLNGFCPSSQQLFPTPSYCNCGNSNNFSSNSDILMDEVNFKYLKHVIVKFLTSREVEARHLIRAVATLLKLNKDEEKLLHDTLNWKMSWFGSKPDHGSGQRAFSIPPS